MKIKLIASFATFLGLFACETLTRADLVVVNNASFESTTLGEGASTPTINGWFKFGSPVSILNPTATEFPNGMTTDGSNVAMFAPTGLLAQNLSDTLQYGTYKVEFDLGNRLDADFAGMLFVMKAGGVGLLPDSSFVPTPADGQFQTASFTFNVTQNNVNGGFVGGALRLEFITLSGNTGFTALDNVRVDYTQAVPEPSSLGLTGIILCMAIARWRPRR
jgi:hypothetical protein